MRLFVSVSWWCKFWHVGKLGIIVEMESYCWGSHATIRKGPPVPPLIFIGSAIT